MFFPFHLNLRSCQNSLWFWDTEWISFFFFQTAIQLAQQNVLNKLLFSQRFEIPSLAHSKFPYLFGSIAELSIPLLVQNCFNYYSFIIHFNIWRSVQCFLFQKFLDYSLMVLFSPWALNSVKFWENSFDVLLGIKCTLWVNLGTFLSKNHSLHAGISTK